MAKAELRLWLKLLLRLGPRLGFGFGLNFFLWIAEEVTSTSFCPKSSISNVKMSKSKLSTSKMSNHLLMLSRRGLVVKSQPATEETGSMGREFESRQGIGW
jgi:hypothetical protein